VKTELSKRIVSGIILGTAVLFITWWDPISFAAMCALGGFILMKEWHALTRTRGPLWLVLGVVYIGAALASLIALRNLPVAGTFTIFYLFLLVWSGDIGGYVVGKLIGKHKIAPSISPGKSWEGLAGSIAATAGVLIAISSLGLFRWPWWAFILIGSVIAIVGFLGDLFESWLKRGAGVKDSGTLIPGHGGLFDRTDALLAVSILFGFFYFILPDLLHLANSGAQ